MARRPPEPAPADPPAPEPPPPEPPPADPGAALAAEAVGLGLELCADPACRVRGLHYHMPAEPPPDPPQPDPPQDDPRWQETQRRLQALEARQPASPPPNPAPSPNPNPGRRLNGRTAGRRTRV